MMFVYCTATCVFCAMQCCFVCCAVLCFVVVCVGEFWNNEYWFSSFSFSCSIPIPPLVSIPVDTMTVLFAAPIRFVQVQQKQTKQNINKDEPTADMVALNSDVRRNRCSKWFMDGKHTNTADKERQQRYELLSLTISSSKCSCSKLNSAFSQVNWYSMPAVNTQIS